MLSWRAASAPSYALFRPEPQNLQRRERHPIIILEFGERLVRSRLSPPADAGAGRGSASRIVLCEPFLIPSMPERACWREDLNPKIDVVRSLAREFSTVLVSMDGIFSQACLHREPTFWSADGVHPTQPGHALMAHAWLQAVGAM